MGWRPGQGIGPRITHRQKAARSHATVRMFGCSLPSEYGKRDSDEDSDDERVDPRYRDFLFAPDDIPEFLAKPKENLSGIGYKGLDRATVLSSHINLFEPPVKFADKANKKSMKISGQAFGVGAYEVEDEDIYARDDMSRYDFELAPMEDDATKKTKKSRWNEPIEEVAKCLEGFVLAKSASAVKKIFSPPEIPPDYRPRPVVKKSRFDVQEKTGPPPPAGNTNPSVRERHSALAAPGEKPLEQGESSGEQIKKLLSSAMPSASSAASFKPFARDADKQKRYEQYLVCLKNNRHDALALLQPKTMTEWEREREKVEFERAAMLYRPMTGSMNSKFVSAGSSEDADGGKETAGPGLLLVDEQVAHAKRAAQMKMYGKLTREKVEWHPAKLLCIRFNVKPPYADESLVGVVKSSRNKFELFGALSSAGKVEGRQMDVDDRKEIERVDEAQPGVRTEEREAEEEEEEEPFQKAPMDLFKSIFLDSSSSEGEDEETPKSPVPKAEKSGKKASFGTELDSGSEKPLPWQEKKENILRNPAPAQGIFANIDFDALNKKKARGDKKDEAPSTVARANERLRATDFFEEEESSDSDEAFGPRKPPQIVVGKDSLKADDDDDSNEDSEEWEEKKPSRSKEKPSKRAKVKKQKKEKKKKKSKKKERKRHKRSREESDSASSSS
jgi:G patch domain-containing protein 1